MTQDLLKLNHRLAFHVPHVAFVNGEYIGVPYEWFEERLGEKLMEAGFDGWHIVSAVGAYKGRRYEQDILVVFSDFEAQNKAVQAYKSVCKELAGDMKQESFAYEHDGVLVVFSVNE